MTSNARPNSTEHQPSMIASDIWLLAGIMWICLETDSADQ
jgi:hypothetical protein